MTTTAPNRDLRERLRAARDELAELRSERAALVRDREAKKAALAALPTTDIRQLSRSPEFRAAEGASRKAADVAERIEAAQEAEAAILAMLGESPGGGRRRPAAIGDLSAPGAWLASIAQGGGMLAAIDGLTTDDGLGSRTDVGAPFVDRLSTASAILASGPTVVDIDSTEIKVPRLSGRLDPAPVVPELEPIPEVEAPLDEITVKPPKIARLAVLSEEAWRDARPAVLAGHERELVRSVAAGFDVAAFSGVAGDADLPGILGTSGVAVPDVEGSLDNLDAFVDGIAALRAVGATATAIYAHPLLWGHLGRLKRSADSNVPLVSAELVADGPRLSLLGVPVFLSEHLDESTAVVAQASELLVVRRTGVEVRVAENYKFAEAGVGVRVIWRAALVVPQPEAVAMLHLDGVLS
jgi:HK97 family phage major capsid protein